MPKQPSEATQIRTLKRELSEMYRSKVQQRDLIAKYRARASQAEAEVKEWKKRFDTLLQRESPE